MILLLAGCGGLTRRAPSATPPRIEVGKTQKRDVVELLGLPNRMGKVPQADGSTVERWFYFNKPDAQHSHVEFRMSSTTLRDSALREDIEIILEIDASGVVSRIVAQGGP